MAELDLDALEQAAREAGGGCWFSAGRTVGSRGFEVGGLKSRNRICSDATERCAEFIAAANPATILELLGRLKAAEKEREELHALVAVVKKQARSEYVLRVKKEEECTQLRARIEAMEQPEQARLVTPTAYRWRHRGSVMWQYGELTEETVQVAKEHNHEVQSLYALLGAQPAPSAPSEEAAAEMGANGGHVVEAERLAFEAWMRGHCWKLGAKWTGTGYRSDFEKGGMVDTHAMRTRELWAAWRDRAALAAAPEAKP